MDMLAHEMHIEWSVVEVSYLSYKLKFLPFSLVRKFS